MLLVQQRGGGGTGVLDSLLAGVDGLQARGE
jgi:hypothetical protein